MQAHRRRKPVVMPRGPVPRARRRTTSRALVHVALATIGCAVASAADGNGALSFSPPLSLDPSSYRQHRLPTVIAAAERASQPGLTNDGVCQAVLLPRFAHRPLSYPGRGRLKLGSATITVRYMIDAQGETEDASIAVVYERSDAARPRYFDLFAISAQNEVKRYRYVFRDRSSVNCSKRQELVMRFEFNAF